MEKCARMAAVATAVPPVVLHQEELMDRFGGLFPNLSAEAEARMLPVFENAGIDTRYSCVPLDWYERPHGWAEKNRLFVENAVDLLEVAAGCALEKAGMAITDMDAIISVSTTGIATPSLDALVMERMGARRDVERLPIFGLGCAGGVIGLARAATMARSRPGGAVLLLVVELCALTFRRADESKSNLVATALFGDGAAAAVITAGGDGAGPAITASGEHTWPNSLDIMGWSVEDDGLGVIFSRDIPSLTRSAFRDAALEFLRANGLTLDQVDEFVCHPGGAKVLDALEEAFGLAPGELHIPRQILRQYGNMSAVTVLFVLDSVLQAGRSGRYLLSTLGPGFTAAYLTMDNS